MGNKKVETFSLSKFIESEFFKLKSCSTASAATIFISLTGVSKLVIFFGVLLLAKILDPRDFGYYSLIQTFLLYVGLSHFGLLNAHIKEYPILLAQGKTEDADNLFLSSFYTSSME